MIRFDFIARCLIVGGVTRDCFSSRSSGLFSIVVAIVCLSECVCAHPIAIISLPIGRLPCVHILLIAVNGCDGGGDDGYESEK